jgi:hypothetical protein
MYSSHDSIGCFALGQWLLIKIKERLRGYCYWTWNAADKA